MTGPRDFDKVPIENRIARAVADGFLSQQGYDPRKVYAFLTALEGAPDITNIRFENTRTFTVDAAVKAEYFGNLPWGEKSPEPGKTSLASDEFKETAKAIIESLADYTAFFIEDPIAHPPKPEYEANIRAGVEVGDKKLTMIITKAEQ